jgi:hypothetical protein
MKVNGFIQAGWPERARKGTPRFPTRSASLNFNPRKRLKIPMAIRRFMGRLFVGHLPEGDLRIAHPFKGGVWNRGIKSRSDG